jgi:hypothetical protein
MKRPVLSEGSFLAHLFHPKKVAQPTGLRKTTLKGGRGTVKRRVNAFNKLGAVQQEVLKRSGTKDTYLRGESTLADAKRKLRGTAVNLGLTTPVKPRVAKPAAGSRARLDEFIKGIVAQNILKKTREAGKFPDPRTVLDEVDTLTPDTYDPAMRKWDYAELKYAGRQGSEYSVWIDGREHNPFWYH